MPAVAAIRDTLAERRTARTHRRRLERELAAYRTPAERLELDEVLARHSADETREVRRILAGQDLSRATSRRRPFRGFRAS
jgi:hypothetical protein